MPDSASDDRIHAEAQAFIQGLTDSARAESPAAFLARNGDGLRSPGLYSWWVDRDGAVDLTKGLGFEVGPGLIYAGLAGATRVRSGLRSKNTLWERIRGMHLGGRHEFSTFRRSLGSILASARGESEIDEEALTTWMHEHLRVLAIPFDDADTLGQLEGDVLRALDPPLNLDKMEKVPLRARLSELRRPHSRKRPTAEAPAIDGLQSTQEGMSPEEIARRSADAMWAGDRASQWLGMELVEVGPGTATVRAEVRQEMVNGHDMGHGGITFSVADSAFAFACNSHNRITVAASAEIRFRRPTRLGDVLVATAVERDRDERGGLCDVTVTVDGEVVAEFLGRSREIGGALFE